MLTKKTKFSTGWLPDLPDFRDCSFSNISFKEKEKSYLIKINSKGKKYSTIDLREYCSPIEDQGNLRTCSTHAGVGLYEYYQRRAFGDHIDCSRLFLYKASRNLMMAKGDTGAYLRTTMGAMVLFGIPPEKYWEYKEDNFDVEPPAFCYSFASNFQALKYFRLDPVGLQTTELIEVIKQHLVAGIPSMMGFTFYNSIEQGENNKGKIPFPLSSDRVVGGHAVSVVGYDDNMIIINKGKQGKRCETRGALLIRNSWGMEWGDEGYGWLPYEYVLKGMARDCWTLMNIEWIETGQFDIGLK